MDMAERKTERLNILVAPSLKAKFQECASAEGLNLSAWVMRVLTLATKAQKKAQ